MTFSDLVWKLTKCFFTISIVFGVVFAALFKVCDPGVHHHRGEVVASEKGR